MRVLIAGGGIGGLSAALALVKHGIDVDVYEQAPELKEVGAGIQISSNGTRVLHALGLEQALAAVQVIPTRREIRHWRTGETWNWFELGAATAQRYGTPHIMLHRGDLLGVLADAVRQLKPDAIHLGKRCVGVRQTGEHSADKIKDQIAKVANAIFDVIAEDEKKKHVAEDVRQAAVHEHRSDQRQVNRDRRWLQARHLDALTCERLHQNAIAGDDVMTRNDLLRHG